MSSLVGKTVGGIGCAVVGLPLLAALSAAALIDSLAPSSTAAAPSTNATADVPPAMLALYQRAAPECPGLPWNILAAIGKVETDHGRSRSEISSAGAVGPMQFLPTTFAAYAHPVPPGGQRPPTPWDTVDSVYAAARLLCANGAKDGRDLRGAIWAYNHDDRYVNKVMQLASTYATGTLGPSTSADRALAFARAQLGTPYVWGGDGPTQGGFDCSGLTQAAYRAAGIAIPRVAQAQYDRGPRLPRGTRLLPGDLLFYGKSSAHITHVALYTGKGRIIDAPHPGAVVRQEPDRAGSPAFQGATRPAAPVGGTAR
ncbi:bifunctional lytic transglycosylase/C40 family peptidase [Streptomyces sp. SL13]|uniref:Bifunctional lytic transglycosylase/C40 family peptidase n=1 Tax=Streptantibioticus silvisoli TaxID=2705255 RepID=A0AA90H554_9ACTN|nr:bifunctional lytic transglycosylase/C40 family peptidase [Streptantibioticus silvisoli]MDI5973719.1 bifunctional lytic transglycosylase/C40 family peptidase [Streptantibioticus silvisoli]